MALSSLLLSPPTTTITTTKLSNLNNFRFLQTHTLPLTKPLNKLSLSCSAAKSQTNSVKKRKSSSSKKKKNGKKTDNEEEEAEVVEFDETAESMYSISLPKPPAGFVVDENTGEVLMVAPKRLVTIVDPANNLPLECVIRRVFRSSEGDECMLLCPADMPIQILKSTNIEGWLAVSDEELEAILPTAAYALAKMHLHLVHSGYCYTARGGFCYSEGDIFDFRTDSDEDVGGLPTEGVEVACFHVDGAHYMIYTPSDPLLFVAVKDQNGQFQIADDDLLEDPAVTSAIDEETEFNALVEEEAALFESLLGER